MSDVEITETNNRISAGQARYFDGASIDRPMSVGLITADGQYRYFVESGIFILLKSMAVVAASPSQSQGASGLRREKNDVKSFYDRVGLGPRC